MNCCHPWPSIKHLIPAVLKTSFLLLTGIGCVVLVSLHRQNSRANIPDRAGLDVATPPSGLSSHVTNPAALQEALRIEGTPDSHLQAFFGDEMFARGDYGPAAERYLESISQNPTHEGLHLKLGLCRIKLQQYDAAITNFQEAVYIAPDFVEAHYELALALLKKNRFADAAGHFHEVTTLRPNHATAFNYLGVALAHEGKFNSAHNALVKAIRLRPIFAEARFNLAQVYLKKGFQIDAARELDQALRINPEFALARNLRHTLRIPPKLHPASPQSLIAAAESPLGN